VALSVLKWIRQASGMTRIHLKADFHCTAVPAPPTLKSV
jgi:hypothetical protein